MSSYRHVRQEADRIVGILTPCVSSSLPSDVPPVDLNEFRSMVAAGEAMIGFETLCEQLYENQTPLSSETISRLTDFCRLVGADLRFVELLHAW
jgi:hypothetical protein